MAFATTTGVAEGAARREFELLNLARFVGAFWVLLYHANLHFGTLPPLTPIAPLLEQGVLAMTLFFVLSGFVLAMRYTSFDAPGLARAFYLARLIRLYPVYLFMALITAPFIIYNTDQYALYQASPAFYFMVICALMIFALQAWVPALFGVWNFGGSWSLSVEAFFYALLPKLRSGLAGLTDGRLCAVIFASIAAMAVFLAANLVTVAERPYLFYILPLFRLPEFVIGVAAFILCVERGACMRLLTVLALPMGAAAFLLIFSVDLPGLIDFGVLVALPFAMLFVFGIRLTVPPMLARLFNYLGHISYALYLAQFATVPYYKVFFQDKPQAVSWLVVIGSTLLLANFVYFCLEAPIRARLKRKLVARGLM